MNNKKKVALVFGGRSAEHEVSIRSAKNIAEALDKNIFDPYFFGISQSGTWFYFSDLSIIGQKTAFRDQDLLGKVPTVSFASSSGQPVFYVHGLSSVSEPQTSKITVDVAFPIIHGTYGEDGCIQGLMQMLNLPFVGCGVLSSALGMDKDYMKKVFKNEGLPTSPWIVLNSWRSKRYEDVVNEVGIPFFIKPANAGSSVGVHKIKSREDFQTKIKDAFLYDHKVLAEKYIQGREIECSVMGLVDSAKASLPGEVITKHEFYSYEAKYIDENGAEIKIPANLSADEIQRIQKMAEKVFSALGCSGMARVDFFLTPKGEIFVNEINTIPGFTNISMYPKMWEATGISYTQLITDLIHLAIKQYERESSLKRTFL